MNDLPNVFSLVYSRFSLVSRLRINFFFFLNKKDFNSLESKLRETLLNKLYSLYNTKQIKHIKHITQAKHKEYEKHINIYIC